MKTSFLTLTLLNALTSTGIAMQPTQHESQGTYYQSPWCLDSTPLVNGRPFSSNPEATRTTLQPTPTLLTFDSYGSNPSHTAEEYGQRLHNAARGIKALLHAQQMHATQNEQPVRNWPPHSGRTNSTRDNTNFRRGVTIQINVNVKITE